MARNRATSISTGPTITDAEYADLDRRLSRMLTKPQRSDDGGLLVWLARDENDEPQVMMWQPETADEVRGATLFYEAAHGLGAFAKPVGKGKPVRRSATETALIRAILQHRDDDTGYLVYADYLTEQGNAQGDFIRLCVQLEQLPPGDPARAEMEDRREELLGAHAEEWYAPLSKLGLRPEIYGTHVPWLWIDRHGVIDEVTIDRGGILPENATRLFAAAPFLRKLEFEPGHLDPSGLAKVKQLEQIEELELSRTGLTAPGLAILLKAKYLTRLKTLLLVQNPLGDAGAAVLANWPGLARLESLDVSGCDLESAGIARLANSRYVVNLKRLRLGRNALDADALRALLGSRHLTALTDLELADADIESVAPQFRTAAFAKTLQVLDLANTSLPPSALAELSVIPLPALESLSLHSVPLSPIAVSLLTTAHWTGILVSLNLDNTRLGSLGVESLGEGQFARLTTLDLSRNRIRNAGAVILAAAAKAFPVLSTLKLWDNQIGADGAVALADSEVLANVTELDLNGNRISPAGARALAHSKHLTKLTSLTVDEKAIGKKGKQALIDRFGEGALNFR